MFAVLLHSGWDAIIAAILFWLSPFVADVSNLTPQDSNRGNESCDEAVSNTGAIGTRVCFFWPSYERPGGNLQSIMTAAQQAGTDFPFVSETNQVLLRLSQC